jgi:hypothetical protein
MKTILFLIALVALAVLAGMAILGLNPFASPTTFAICTAGALLVAVVVVGFYSITKGSPRITRVSKV